MYVKADFEPIVTEEEWHRCEAIRKSRRRELNIPVKRKAPFGEESVTSPRRESHDKWNRKLRCACGSRLRKSRWHKNKNKEWSYGYECYNQINNGSAKKRREQGLDDTGFCEVQMVADWKLEVMCKMLLERIWQDKKTVIRDACSILKKCYQADVDNEEECFAIQKKIAKIKSKIDNLIDLRTEGDISKEEYRDRRKKLDMELTEHENQLLEQQAMKKNKPLKKMGLNWERINETLEELLDFSKPIVDNELVDKFIAKIIPQGNNRFTWFVNLSSLKTEELDIVVEGRKNHATVCIKDKDSEETEDDESSLHSNMLYLQDIASSFQEKKYSPVPTLHRQRLHRSEQFLLKKESEKT